jgi:prolipoprotein diacylglyceryl transferase
MLAAIPPPPDNAIELGPLTIRFYGILIALGVVVAIVVTRRRYAARGGDPELVDRVALWGVIAGIVGARLGWVSTNLDRVIDSPLRIVAIWEGGLAFFGGLVLGVLVTLYVLRRSRADLPAFLDAAAPAVPLAHAIGRWGNYFNEELFGTPTDLPWALELGAGQTVHEPGTLVHPTFLYESLANLALALVLMWLGRRALLRAGGLVFVYLMGYGIIRVLNEQLRIDANWEPFGMAINAWNALGILLLGVVGLVWWQRGAPTRRRPAHDRAAAGAGADPPAGGDGAASGGDEDDGGTEA